MIFFKGKEDQDLKIRYPGLLKRRYTSSTSYIFLKGDILHLFLLRSISKSYESNHQERRHNIHTLLRKWLPSVHTHLSVQCPRSLLLCYYCLAMDSWCSFLHNIFYIFLHDLLGSMVDLWKPFSQLGMLCSLHEQVLYATIHMD